MPGRRLNLRHPAPVRRSPRRLIDRAGVIDGRGRPWHAGAEALESRTMLAVFDPGGAGIGSLTPGSLALGPADEVIIDVNPSAPGATNDVIAVAGSTGLNGVLNLRVANASALLTGQTYSILTSGSGSLSGSFLNLRNIDAGSTTLNFVALQSAAELRLVVTDLPTPTATIIVDPSLTPAQQLSRLDALTAWFAAGSSNTPDATLAVPGLLAAYGQRFVGTLTLSTDAPAGTRVVDIAVGELNANPARLVLSAGVLGAPSVGVSAYGSTTLRVSPAAGGTSSLSLNAFTVAGFALGDQAAPSSLAGSSGRIGPVSFTGFTLGLSNVSLSGTGFSATVTVTAATAALNLGGSAATNTPSAFSITASNLSASVAVSLGSSGSAVSEAPGSGRFSISADDLTMEVRDVVTVAASGGITINAYDDTLPASQTLVSVGEATIDVPRLGLLGTFAAAPGSSDPGLVIRGDGFAFGALTVGLNTDAGGGGADADGFLTTAGGRLRVKNPALRLGGFSMTFNSAGQVTQTTIGSFGVQADEVRFTPFAGPSAARFNATASGLEMDLVFGTGIVITPGQPVLGSPTGVRIAVASINITLGFVQVNGSDIELNTAATGDEYFLIVAGTISAQLNLADALSNTSGPGPNIQITGTAGGFAVKGDGTFEPFTDSSPAPYNDNPFEIRLLVDSTQVTDVLEDVANLPDSLPTGAGPSGSLDLRISWPDFNADPERFLMRLSGGISGQVGGPSGLMLAFSVEDLQVDSAKVIAGEFPIVGLTSFSGSVSGTIMGSEFNGAIVLGLVRFDSAGAVLPPVASPDDIAASRLYVGARGGLTLPNGWGVQVQFAFSEKGFLNFYLSSNLDIPLGPSGLSLTGLRGGVTFNATPLPDIDDPADLRNSAFQAPEELTTAEWEDQVRQLVINQFGGTPGFLFEVDQTAGQDWTALFDDNADPGLYLPEAIRTAFLDAGIAIPRKAGASSIQTLVEGELWLLTSGQDAFVVSIDGITFSVSQLTLTLAPELIDNLPASGSASAGSISATIDAQSRTLVQLFADTGRVISPSALVAPTANDDEWTVTDGQVVYTLGILGDPGSQIIAVTGGDPSFESGAGMTIRLDAGFSLSNTGASAAWRIDADAIIQFVVGGPSNTKIILLGDLSVGPAASPTLSIDTRLLIDLTQSGSVTTLMLADFRNPPPAATPANPTPDAPIPFFSLYGNSTFSFTGGQFTFSLTGSQTRGVAVFDTAGLIDSPLGSQRVLLGAPTAPGAMDGAGELTVSFNASRARVSFAANISLEGLVDAASVVFATGDFTVEFSSVSVGALGSIRLPTALYGAAYLNASLNDIDPLAAAGITGEVNLQLKINTTSVAQTAVLRNRPPLTGDTTISIAPRSFALFGDGNLSFRPPVVGSLFNMQIAGAFGVEVSASGGASLFIVGTMPLPIPGASAVGLTSDVVGLLRITTINNVTHFGARLELGVQNRQNELSFFRINAALQLYVNTAGEEISYTMPRDIAGRLGTTLPPSVASRLVWSGTGDASIVVPARAPLITYSTDGAVSPDPGGYFVVQGFGNIDILDPISRTPFLSVDASARLSLQVDASNPAAIATQFRLEMSGAASLGGVINISMNAGIVIATTFDTTPVIPRLTSVNMAGLLSLSASASLGGVVTLSGSGSVRINTFSTPQPVAGSTLEPNSVGISITGDLVVGGVFRLTGTFNFVNNAQRIAISGTAELDLYVARVAIDFNAAIFKSIIVNGVETNNPGLVINIGVSLDVDFLSVFNISGDGRLRVSTRAVETLLDTAPAGQQLVPARINASTPFVNIRLDASVDFLDLVTVNGFLDFTTINDTEWQPAWGQSAKRHWRIEGALTAAAGVSFLGGAEARIGNARRLDGSLSGRNAVFYDTGEFDIDASLRVQLGPNEFNVNGRAYAFATYLRNASGQKILSFGGGAALGIQVDVDLGETDFGLFTVDWGSIRFSFDAVSVTFDYNGNTGEVSITPCVIGICKTFTLGFFKLPPGATQRPITINLAGPLSYTPRPANDGPLGVFDETVPWSGGVLFLNAGDRAQFRNLSNTVIDEDFIIEPDGDFDPVLGSQNLKVSAFGQTQARAGVTSIQALMGSGIDNVIVRPGVLVPILIDAGEGNDKITYSALGVATIRGGAGNDLITAAGASGSSIDGQAGNDVITWLAGNGAAVAVTGGDGSDTLVATFTDQADRIRLGRTAPEQFRVSKLNAAGASVEFVSVTGGVETLRINTRAGADELTIDDFDAAGMNIAFDVSRFQSGTRAVATADGGTAEAPVYSNDASPDTVLISGRNAAELFTLASPADAADLDADGNASEGLLTLARSSGGSSLYALTILNAVPATGEALTVRALGGNDTIDASAVTLSLARLTLSGGADDDTITGSPLADTILGDDTDGSGSGNDTINAGAGDDVIDSGLGDDTVTGGLGTDTYADAGGIDTFVETRDRDVFISDNRFVVGTLSPASMLGFADAFSAADEVENLAGIFNTARLTGGAAANTFTIGDVSGALSIPGNTALPAAQQWSGTITVDGRSGADRYVVTVFGLSGAVINISDTGKLGAGSDSLRVFGSDDAARSDLFLLRRGFVAAAVDANADGLPETIDRVNFTAAIDAGLTVDALAGDDRIIVDQTLIATTLRGGAGRDLFQFGQIFGAERTPPAVAPGDEISTVAILLSTPSGTPVTARLSSGPTHPLTAFGGDGDDAFVVLRTVSPINLRGEAGDDFFSVRAFEQVGGGGTTPGNTSVAGGAGSNLIEFVANAPIDIDGGEGIDTVRLLGTFRNDQYIVDASGVFGPGTTVTYTAVEILEINSGDGDDEVFIRSTPATMRVVVFGGAGSDRIAVGIPVPGSPASPLDNSLSGIAGPVLLDGGPGAPGAFGLPVALRLPTETDAPLPAGAGGMLSDEQPGDLDTVDIRATSATAALTGSMAPRLWPDGSSLIPVVTLAGLGMGPDLVQGAATVPGGISLRRLEVVDARLGSGDDTLSISAVLAGASTVIRTLGGADTINVTAPATPTAFVAIFTDAAPGELFSGAPGADRVNALTAGLSMLIETGELDDVVLSGSGDDRIAAGPGDDVIAAGAGDDLVLADSRLLVDRVTTIATIDTSGPAGADIINPGDGLNIVFADHGLIAQDSASAGRFAPYGVFTSALTVRPTIGAGDTISAFASASPLFAGLPAAASGSDIVFGGAGADRIDTGDGRDWIVADHASAQIGPVAFPDLGPLSGPPIASDAYLAQPRERLGAKTALVINPTDPTAGAGDTINSGDDADVVVAGPGSDTIDSGAGNDWVFGDSALVDPFAPRDQRFLSVFAADPAAGDADRITTGDGDDIVMGQHGADIIFAGAGDDDIIGGHNTPGGLDSGDAIDAGAGDDAVIGDNGRIDRLPGHRSPRFVSPAGPALSGSTVGSMYDADLNASVSAPAPTGPGAPLPRRILLIDASPSTPASRFGADRIAGGAGRDVILGGNADDTLRGDSRLTNDPDPALAPSLNASTDADDYVEGNAGNDTIFGDLGQDDLVGGSSDLFGLTAPDRADGSDTIFGGDGSRTAFNDAGDASASRDADVIAGDNASIFRLVGPGGLPIAYAFDASITPRVVRLLDYTTDSLPAGDTGAADLIRAESGNDTVYAMTGNDVIYGDAGDDDLIGGSGDDWIYAGSGDDAVLGDDGRLLTSRNGLAEPLFNLPAQAQQTATTPDALFTRTVFSTGSLLRSARLSNHASGGADVIFGGLGNDAIHGGGGSDALSGAQSLPEFYTPPATPPTLVFNASLRRFTVYEPGFALRKVPNFFLNFSSGPIGSPINDGADALFGGHGNDWLVGGTASDLLFGGMGDDVLNADDTLDTVSPRSGNNLPDVGADATPDIAFGGGGLDRLISGSSNDRLIDWNGEFNQYVAPYIAAYPTIIRTPTTAIVSALRLLGAGAGADTRLTEPDAELGIVLATDPQWAAQFGRPTP